MDDDELFDDLIEPAPDANADLILKYLVDRSHAERGAVLAFAGIQPDLAVVACQGGPAVAALERAARIWRDHQRLLKDGEARVIEDSVIAPLTDEVDRRHVLGLLYLSRSCSISDEVIDYYRPHLVRSCEDSIRREPLYTESYLASLPANDLERLQLDAALRRHGKISIVARVLKQSRKTIARKIKRFGIPYPGRT